MSNPVNGTVAIRFLSALGRDGMAAVAPATVNVADPAGLTDLNSAQLSIDATGRLRVQLGATVLNVQPSVLADSLDVAARVVAPAAGGAIATIAAPAAGTWDVQVLVGFDVGAPVAADINNFEFRKGAAVVGSLQAFAVINVYGPVRTFRMVLNGATNVSVNATGAGTAGVGYSAQLTATRVA